MKTKPSKPVRITDRPEYAAELSKLDRVKAALQAASLRLEAATRGRLTEAVGRYLGKAPTPMRGIPETVLDSMALEAAAEGGVSERLAKKMRVYAAEVPFEDRYDKETVEAIFEAERTAVLLTRAVGLQDRRVQEQKKIAIAEVCNATRGERERIARGVAASALDLIRAVSEESAFFEGLKAQDETLPGLLRPGAFPAALGPDSVIFSWLAAVLGVSEGAVRSLVANPQLENSRGAASGEVFQ